MREGERMVRCQGGGGSGEKQEGGEGGEQRGRGNVLALVGSARVAIREGGRWRRLVVAVRGGRRWRRLVVVIRCRSLWTSFVVVHRALLSVVRSCPTRVVKRFGVAGLAFGVGRGGGAGRQRSCVVDAGGVALVGCVHPVMARGGRVWVSWALVVIWACCVLRASLLPLLGGRGILLGRCCRSWTAGVVVFMWRCMGSTWWRSGRGLSLAVCRGCGRRRWRGGC